MEFDEILTAALAVAQARYPEAASQRHAAFANGVALLVTGASGGYGGPSVREHAVGWTYAGRRFSYEAAVKELIRADGLIFGPLTQIHRACWESEHCFDDDPADVAFLTANWN